MKKFVSFLLVLVLVFAVTACGSNDQAATTQAATTAQESTTEADTSGADTSNTATISVQVESDWLAYYETAKARVLERYPNATINFIESTSFDHLDVLDATDVTNTDVADVFALPADRIYGLAQNEVLASMDALKMAEYVGGFDDYDSGLGGNFNINGDYLAFPMNIETLINFANKANAEAAGIDLSQPVEFTTLGYEDMLVPVFNAWFGVALTNTANIEMLGYDADGNLYSDLTADWADLPAEKQAVMTAIYDYWKKHDEAGTSLWDADAAWGYMDESFTSGGATAIRLEGPWSTASLSALANDGQDIEILPITQVTLNGVPLAHWKGGWGLGINARVEGNDDQMALAEAFIEEVVNTDYAVDFFKASGKILENVDESVYMNSDLSDTDKTVIAAVIESYKVAPARPLFTEWGSVWDTWQNSLLSWASVKPASAEEAYAQVQAAFQAMMLNF